MVTTPHLQIAITQEHFWEPQTFGNGIKGTVLILHPAYCTLFISI
ncbi:hypothetical protein I314_02436, partial [Cryptococcus bacillisporus CA1873]